jgi:transcriptional regulator with XRE-family HTH domain
MPLNPTGSQNPKLKIAERIRVLRAQHQMTQEQLATAVGVQARTLGFWEREDEQATEPAASAVLAIASVFGVTTDYLLGISEHPSGLAPDTWIADEAAIEYLRSHPKRRGKVVWSFKVPRRLRLLPHHEHEELRKELGD